MNKLIIQLVLFPLILVLLLNIWFYLQQPAMMFFPVKELIATPQSWGLEYEEVILKTSDQVNIHGWFLPSKSSDKLILYFHGNAGNISHRGETIKIFHKLGLNVLIVDYRGYGKSEGAMNEQGAYRDARAAWQYLLDVKGFEPNQIIIFGRSLGGAVATHLASLVDERALIIESTFSSVQDMSSWVMPVINKVIWLRYAFNTEQKIGQIGSPLLLMHSQDDEIIPYELAEKIFKAAKSPKFFHELKGDHNSGFLNDVQDYYQALNWFIQNS